jgi:hypothetical protein
MRPQAIAAVRARSFRMTPMSVDLSTLTHHSHSMNFVRSESRQTAPRVKDYLRKKSETLACLRQTTLLQRQLRHPVPGECPGMTLEDWEKRDVFEPAVISVPYVDIGIGAHGQIRPASNRIVIPRVGRIFLDWP